jgi:hypothetical protein
MSDAWTDNLAGARMQVDQQFNDRILDSQFSNQEWGLIMTAVEFDIENPGQPEEATLVADTEDLEQVIPELDKIKQQMGGSSDPTNQDSSSGLLGGRLGKYLDALQSSSQSSNHHQQLNNATTLVNEYALELQRFLEAEGRWTDICALAADGD